MRKLILVLTVAVVPFVASCGTDDSADLEQEVADQAATIDARDEEIADLEQEVADQAAVIEPLEAELADLEQRAADQAATIDARDEEIADLEQGVADQAAVIESLEAQLADLGQQATGQTAAAEEQAPAADSDAWLASLEASIAAGLNERWAGEYDEHEVSCPALSLEDLNAGDEFTCSADCECVFDPARNVIPTDIEVTYEGDRSASWAEILDDGGTGGSGSFEG